MSTGAAPVQSLRRPAPADRAARAGSPLAGTGHMLRLALRRDRILLPGWLLGIAGMATMSAQATVGLYPELPQRIAAAEVVNGSAALIALYGRVYDPTSLGELSMFKLTAFGAAIIGVLFGYLAVRHTRAEEEAGRLELVAATAVGRSAPLASALLLATGAAATLALLTGIGLFAAGLPLAGSLAFGTAWGATGLVFAAVGAVASQLTQTRGAIGLSLVVLAVAYLARAVGDLAQAGPGWLTWLSPIGWTQQVRAFSGTHWAVLVLPVLATAVLMPVAFALRSHRDLGAGLLADRPGPARGRVSSTWGLAARLHRLTFLSWAGATLIMGFVLGSVADSVEGFLDSPTMQDILVALAGRSGLVDMFLAAELGMVGAIMAAYGMVAVRWLHSEEAAGRAEVVLTAGTPRRSWALSHAMLGILGVATLIGLLGLAIGSGYAVAVGDPGQLPRLVGAAAARIPAALVMLGIAVAIWGSWPRLGWVPWLLYVAFLALGEFGTLWGVPDPVMDLSPFRHSPVVPGPAPQFGALPVLLVVAAGLVTVGVWRFTRRDLAAG